MLLPGHLLTSDWRVAMMRASTKSEVPQVALQDDDSPAPSENAYMKRYSVANYAHRMRAGLAR